MLWFNFIFGLNFIFLCCKLIIIHYHIQYRSLLIKRVSKNKSISTFSTGGVNARGYFMKSSNYQKSISSYKEPRDGVRTKKKIT